MDDMFAADMKEGPTGFLPELRQFIQNNGPIGTLLEVENDNDMYVLFVSDTVLSDKTAAIRAKDLLADFFPGE